LGDRIPQQLAELTGDRFEIRYVEGTSSHRKLVPALTAFPGRVIVTCDDDVMYDADWLTRLWADHERFPMAVVAHEGRAIGYATDGSLRPYAQWRWEERPGVAYDAFVPVGYGGALYPPGALLGDVTDESLYLSLTPSADDLWFK